MATLAELHQQLADVRASEAPLYEELAQLDPAAKQEFFAQRLYPLLCYEDQLVNAIWFAEAQLRTNVG